MWAWYETKYALRFRQIVEVRPGWSLLCHPAACRFAYCAQTTDRDQISEFNAFIASCRPGMLLFDIGAHFGIFSFAALHYGGASARAIAVDPSPTASRIMRIQAGLNNLTGRLRVVQASVGDQVGWQEMVAAGVIAAGYFVAPNKEHAKRDLTRIRATTLDELAQECGTLPTHVKIDVEGFEAAVLRGGREVLSGAKAPLLFIELHNRIVRERNGDPLETLQLLKSAGYQPFAVGGRTIDEGQILHAPLTRITARKLTIDN